jgi:hypothetical protein
MKSDWNKDAFIPFSAGPRACLGRRSVEYFTSISARALTNCQIQKIRFAEMESVAAITMLVSQYKITLKELPQYANETFEQRKERLLKSTSLLTLTCVSSI